MRFLDFQLSRVASPVIDLSYFLYACADAAILKHFDFILQIYHTSFCDFLKDLDCDRDDDIEAVFSLKKLKEHWKDFGKFGLVMGSFVLKLALCDTDEVPDLADTAENGGDFKGTLDITIKNQDEYARRVRDTFLHYGETFL